MLESIGQRELCAREYLGTFESYGAENRGECKCIRQKGVKGVLIFFLGDSYDIKNMVKILGPREEGNYFSRISQS